MKIEFSTLGEGTNIQVALLEMLGETEVVKDRFYTDAHHLNLGGGYCVKAEDLFLRLEDILPPPIIGGEWGHLHPYWHEREERRKRRVQNLELA